ncbi:hypothetical protein HDV06_004922 [Boothiomyces sp. JEL0866]|nr:hypothetical protein HDV06_004922 [Boothiomyces sp. JEL0866]
MQLLTLLVGFALAESSYFSLDELQEGDSVKGDQICNERMCVPLIFNPTEEFQPIYPGQRIPKGLHIRIDYATGIKEAKLMDESEAEENTAVNVTPEVVEEDKDAIIHPPEARNNSALTWEERDTLSNIFDQLNSSTVDIQLQLLDRLAEAAHQVDVGIGLASNLDQILFLLTLLEHSDQSIRSQTAVLLGTVYSNNHEATAKISTIPGFISTILSAFKKEESVDVQYRLMYLISAVTRSSDEVYQGFKRMKLFSTLLQAWKLGADSTAHQRLQRRILNYLIDIKGHLDQTDFKNTEWCNVASKESELSELMAEIGSCKRESSELNKFWKIDDTPSGAGCRKSSHKHRSIQKSSRMDDQASVADILNGIYALLESQKVSKTEQLGIPGRIFNELNVQNYPQGVRNTVFKIFNFLMVNNLDGLKKLGSEFVVGFVHVMDGEKDPRNLVLSFELARLIVLNLDYKKHAQELFEVVFCYFPITFRPPPDDPYGVTAEQLKELLRNVIASTPTFSKFAIPVLIEKLDSTSASAKRDAMETISACLPVYGGASFLDNLPKIWEILKKTMADGAEEATELAALKCILQLSKSMGTAIVFSKDNKNLLERFLDMVISDCVRYLGDAELKYAKPCSKILLSAASASNTASEIVLKNTFKTLADNYSQETAPAKKKIILDVIVDLLLSSKLTNGAKLLHDPSEADMLTKTAATPYKEVAIELLIPSLVSETYAPLKKRIVEGLYILLSSKGLLDEKEVSLLFSHLNALAIEKDEEIAGESLKFLENLSEEQPTSIKSLSVRYFQDKFMQEASAASAKAVLNALAVVSKGDLIFESSLSWILATAISSTKSTDINSQLVTCARQVIVARQAYETSGNDKLLERQLLLDSDENLKEFEVFASIILRSISDESQTKLMKTYYSTLSDISVPAKTANECYLFKVLVCNLKRTVTPYPQDLYEFLVKFTDFAVQKNDQLFVQSAAAIISSIINKAGQGLSTRYIQYFENIFQSISTVSTEVQTALFTFYGWIAKSLVVKLDPKGTEISAILLDYLNSESVGQYASEAIQIIVQEDKDCVLTKRSFAVTRLFPMLVQSLTLDEPKLKLATLTTFNLMAKEMPTLLAQHIDTMVSNLLKMSDFRNLSQGNSAYVRVEALRILGLFPGKIEFSILSPFKITVINELGKFLNDPKRVVRKEAANTRGKWYLLVGPKV